MELSSPESWSALVADRHARMRREAADWRVAGTAATPLRVRLGGHLVRLGERLAERDAAPGSPRRSRARPA